MKSLIISQSHVLVLVIVHENIESSYIKVSYSMKSNARMKQ